MIEALKSDPLSDLGPLTNSRNFSSVIVLRWFRFAHHRGKAEHLGGVMDFPRMLDADKRVRQQVGANEDRWPAHKALLLWVCLSLVLWGLIMGGLYILH